MHDFAHDIKRYLDRLLELPFVLKIKILESKKRASAKFEVDGEIEIKTPTGKQTIPCEIKQSHLGHDTAMHLVHRTRCIENVIILAPSIGDALGDLLEREKVNFIDLAGNCHIRLGENYIARIQGRRIEKAPRADKGFRAPSFQVLLASLI